ncbi:hypothetical protein CCR75_002449 [Bremia lactucae]|uniref:THO complex subunit 5 n=1 Tax=Bremia lactucae TaxID=4779 RepID=A0A976FI13_BRELC|nr:hypothetical protein CCR75_002449 [Bremia lactucae]
MTTDGATLQQLQTTCDALKAEITGLYEQRGKKHLDELRVKQRRWRVLLLLTAMKSGLRDTFLESDARRMRVQEQKDVTEAHQLQLQNLLYEKDHLLREIRRCRGFRTKELDKITFLNGPLPIQADSVTHQQHLDQLTQELEARKQLQTELKDLKLQILEMHDAIATKQTFLDTVPDQVAGIQAATTGLQALMGKPIVATRTRHSRAKMELPTPLYVLYCELEAYQEASEDAGKQLHLAIVNATNLQQSTNEYRKRQFPSALHVDSIKKRKPSSSSLTSQDIVSRSPSLQRENSISHERESGEILAINPLEKHQTKEEQKNGTFWHHEYENESPLYKVWTPHVKALELKVSLTLPMDEPQEPFQTGIFTLVFQYYPIAKIVTVEVTKTVPNILNAITTSQRILMNLFPGDDGNQVPQGFINYAFQEENNPYVEMTFPTTASCRPYYWTQYICGLTPLQRPHESNLSAKKTRQLLSRRIEPSLRTVMNQLINRCVTTMILTTHLKQLTRASKTLNGRTLFRVHPLAQSLFPRDRTASLQEWKEIPLPTDEKLQKHGIINASVRADFSCTNCRYFCATFNHEAIQVSAIVKIAPEYPLRAPRFLFQPCTRISGLENQWKEVEIEVNAYYNELIPHGSEQYLLLHQVRKIEMCLDVLCKNAVGDTKTDVSLWFGRERRGKDRRQALVMDPALKELRHR